MFKTTFKPKYNTLLFSLVLSVQAALTLPTLAVLPEYHQDPVKPLTQTQAKRLNQWTLDFLSQHHSVAAVLGRNGTPFTTQFDKTGMGHLGLAIYNPTQQEWAVYQLISDRRLPTYNEADPRAALYQSSIETFFQGQRQDVLEALVLLPEPSVQEALQKQFLNDHEADWFFTDRYDFAARVNDTDSLNCVKWILLTTLAAQKGAQPPTLSELIQQADQRYQRPLQSISFLQRPILASIPGIREDRIPWYGFRKQKIASAEGLYYLDLFPIKVFYSGKRLK